MIILLTAIIKPVCPLVSVCMHAIGIWVKFCVFFQEPM